MTTKTTGGKVQRAARLGWVPLTQLRINPLAQRDLKQSRVDELAVEFDPEQFGTPTVNHRGEWFYAIDGQHRIEALKQWFGEGNWEDQSIQCWTYEGLTEQQEAETFLKLNNTLGVQAFQKFRIGVQAGRHEESDIERIVREEGLRISLERSDGAISAVGTLRRIYRRAGADVLARTLRIVRDAYGDAGLEWVVIDGLGLLCHRYNGDLDDEKLVGRLATARGGVSGLLGKAENLRKQTGNPKAHCVAAAAVEINNSGRTGRRLPSWWRADGAEG